MMNQMDFKSLIKEFSPNTQTIYFNLWKRWLKWCKAEGIESFPITQEALNRFVAQMRALNRSAQYVRHFLPVFKLVNRRMGYDDDLTVGNFYKLNPPFMLLNSAIMPAPGNYHLYEVSREEFVIALKSAENVQSYIGYPDTAKHIQEISGLEVAVNRSETVLHNSATMFIVKLKYRVSDPASKGQFSPGDADYAYYIAQYAA